MYYKSLIETLKEDDTNNRIIVNNQVSKGNTVFIDATLNPKDIYICPQCSSTKVIKFGKKERLIKDDYLSNRITLITLHYNRLKCKDCLKMFNDSLPSLDAKKTLSLPLKLNILEDLKEDISFTTISRKRNVSIQTVINIFESYVSFDRVPFGEVLCMDEFKNLKHSKGKYAFVMYDPNAHSINDILPDRIQGTIDDYLYNVDWHEKDKVKYVVTDMNESYRTIIHKHFKNATHVIDCFHFLRYVEDALNSVRIRIQGLFKDTDKEYKSLKKNWRILSAYYIDVEGENIYNHIQKKDTSATQILNDASCVHKDIEEAYNLTQEFLYGVRTVKYEEASKWMNDWIKKIKESNCKEFVDLAGMFINWKIEIINSFIRFGDKRLHNGYLEGINNKIKVIKRISYGYSNFSHFRNRIMYMINSEYVIKMIDTSKIARKPRKKKS